MNKNIINTQDIFSQVEINTWNALKEKYIVDIDKKKLADVYPEKTSFINYFLGNNVSNNKQNKEILSIEEINYIITNLLQDLLLPNHLLILAPRYNRKTKKYGIVSQPDAYFFNNLLSKLDPKLFTIKTTIKEHNQINTLTTKLIYPHMIYKNKKLLPPDNDKIMLHDLNYDMRSYTNNIYHVLLMNIQSIWMM